MENDIRALVEKLVKAVEYRTKVDLAASLMFTEGTASALSGADSRVENATATLMALVKSAVRGKGTAPMHASQG